MTTLKIDNSHSSIAFVVRHMAFAKVRGSFGKVEGTIEFNKENPSASSVNVTIDANSIDTADENRDNHLRSNDFFGTEENPNITFVSTQIHPDGDDYHVHGDLSMNGVTRPVVLEAEFNGLTRLYTTVPPYVGRSVGPAEISVPRTGDRVVVVLPVDLPAIGGAGTVVSDADRTGEAGAPLIGNDIFTTRHCLGGEQSYRR